MIGKTDNKTRKNIHDVVIIGAGASGLFCAVTAAQRGKSVVILDHQKECAKKLKISGAGKCNFTNEHISVEDYFTSSQEFVEQALKNFSPQELIKYFKKHRIEFEKREGGKLFCKRSSSDLISALLSDCEKLKVKIITSCNVQNVSKDDQLFCVKTDTGMFSAKSLAIASGGLSYPQIGATNLGFTIAKQFGHKVTKLRPALVPLFYPADIKSELTELAGISANVRVTVEGKKVSGDMLFTHTSFSGPAILDASLFWKKNDEVEINFLPEHHFAKLITSKKYRDSKTFLHNFLSQFLRKRLAEFLSAQICESKPIQDLSKNDIEQARKALHHFKLTPPDTQGYGIAEVTAGGVDLRFVDPNTMQSKLVEKLYFIGELLDVTGRVGGFNLHWAFTSAHIAGHSI